MEQESYFPCPYCGEQVSMLFDASVTGQTYVEDCEVCCRPIEVSYRAVEGQISSVSAQRSD